MHSDSSKAGFHSLHACKRGRGSKHDGGNAHASPANHPSNAVPAHASGAFLSDSPSGHVREARVAASAALLRQERLEFR